MTSRVNELRHDLPEVGANGDALAERYGDVEFVGRALQRWPCRLALSVQVILAQAAGTIRSSVYKSSSKSFAPGRTPINLNS